MTTFTVTVEFEIGGTWTDVSRLDANTRVLMPINLTWGRAKPGERVASSVCRFKMLDNNCLFEEDNYASPYFRLVTIGTPARVTTGGSQRIYGRIASLTREPGETPAVSFVNVELGGILRDLDQPGRPLRSAAYQAFSAPENDPYRVFYAPLEEQANATSIEVYGGKGSVADDQPVTFSGDGDTRSSAGLVTFGTNGKLEIEVPYYSSNEHKVCMLLKFPSGGLTNGFVPVRMHTTGGNIDRVHLRFNTPWAMTLDAMKGFTVFDSAVIVDWTGYIDQNQEFFMSIEMTQNGANVDCAVKIMREDGTFGVPTDSFVNVTIGRIYHITIGANDISGSSVGHVAVGSDTTAFTNYIAYVSNVANGVNGYTSENGDMRMFRLLTDQGITFGVSQPTTADVVAMGPQKPKTTGELVHEVVDSDGGMLYEWRGFEALVYASRFALYNQAPVARFDWAHVTAPFTPLTGDVDLYNDMEVNREGGSSGRYVIPDDDWFHRTTQDAPDGVGPKPGRADVSLESDDDLVIQAAWRAHVSSVREKRFTEVTFELGRSAFDSTDRAAVRWLLPGDVFTIDTTPAPRYVPYYETRMMVQGGEEEFSQVHHTVTLHTSPADVYEVDQVDADGSVLAAPITTGSTSIRIAPPTRGPSWTESTEDLPYNIQVAGQPMRVTAISTETPAYIGASATVASANNGPVTPALPVGLTVDTAQLLIIWATIRNSGTGVPDDEPGWDTLLTFGNTKIYGRYYRTGDVAPQITFTGGVANADCLARMFAFSGLSMQYASGTKGTPAAHTLLNSSAVNIAYPAITLTRTGGAALIFVWRQDDFSSLGTPAGFTQVSADASTTGDDAGIGVYYDLTAAAAIAGSIVPVGGAAAISRAVVLALRPLQTATVTRGIDGPASAASVGSEIHGWRQGVNGL
ncbi:MAG: hypothetical protein V4515_14455 [Chloroflexota bacterium]